jgi:simple sugar transport system ATP-binding protein
MKILYGLYDPDAGTITINGEDRSFDNPRQANDAGIGMIHQHFMLVETMTVLENIVLGNEPSGSAGIVDTDAAEQRVREINDTYGLDLEGHIHDTISDIGVGLQQRVEIIKTLYRGADTLIMDEPTAVLTPQEVESLYKVMDELRDRGHSIIFITHKLEEAMTAADEITVLRDGSDVGTVDAEGTSQEELARMMVGREVLFDLEERSHTTGDSVLEVEGLHASDDRGVERVAGVDFTVKEGEILAIAGVEGNGQTEIADAVTGLRSADEGEIRFQGQGITGTSRRKRIESGIAYIPEDRQESGGVMSYDLVKNTLLGNQTTEGMTDGRCINWDALEEHA